MKDFADDSLGLYSPAVSSLLNFDYAYFADCRKSRNWIEKGCNKHAIAFGNFDFDFDFDLNGLNLLNFGTNYYC